MHEEAWEHVASRDLEFVPDDISDDAPGHLREAVAQVPGDASPHHLAVVPFDGDADAVAVPRSEVPVHAAAAWLMKQEGRLDLGQVLEAVACSVDAPCRSKKQWLTSVVVAVLMVEAIGRTPAYRSVLSLSQQHLVPLTQTRITLQRYYAAIFHIVRQQSRRALANLCERVKREGGECLVYSEYAAYDETPMTLKLKNIEDISDLVAAVAFDARVQGRALGSFASVDRKAKLVQTEYSVSILFRIRGAYQEVSCEAPCASQVIDRCTGEAYAELQASDQGSARIYS
jgi:hypothetical protein